MNSELHVSVALCTYNGEAFLREQLNSFSAQTRLPDELVVCDDDSTDGTVDLLTDYATTAPFSVSIHRNKFNIGSNRNFGQAVALCRGDIVFLSDQDDVWRPDKVATVTAAFDRHPTSGLVFSNASLVDSMRKPLGRRLWASLGLQLSGGKLSKQMDLFPCLSHEYLVTGATMAFRRKYIPAVLPIGAGWMHDGWIAYIIAAYSDVIAIDEDLIEYRQHRGQQIGPPPQWEILGHSLGMPICRVAGMAHQWLYGPCKTPASIEAITLQNDVEHALARYQTALERLQVLERVHRMHNLVGGTKADKGRVASIRPVSLQRLRNRVTHLAARCRIRSSPSRAARIGRAFTELRRGGYHRSGMGFLSFMRDTAGF